MVDIILILLFMGNEQIEYDQWLIIDNYFYLMGKTLLSRNQTMGKFFSGTANDPFTSTWQNIFFFFFSNQNWVLSFVAGKVLLKSVRWCLLRQHKELLHAGSVIGFWSGWLKESSSCFIRNDSGDFQLSEQHTCGVIERAGESLWSRCAWSTSWSCLFLSMWTLAT